METEAVFVGNTAEDGADPVEILTVLP